MTLGELFKVIGNDDIRVKTDNDDGCKTIFECTSYGCGNMSGFPHKYQEYLGSEVKEITISTTGNYLHILV